VIQRPTKRLATRDDAASQNQTMKEQPAEQTAFSVHADQAAVAMSQAMQQAATEYTRGEWAEAERLCRRILAAPGNYLHALNLLGIVAARTRRTEEAADLLGRAVAASPGDTAITVMCLGSLIATFFWQLAVSG